MPSNFHKAWDEDLINMIVWDWGAYVDRLEGGWLKSAEARQEKPPTSSATIGHATIVKWAEADARDRRQGLDQRRTDNVLDDNYLTASAARHRSPARHGRLASRAVSQRGLCLAELSGAIAATANSSRGHASVRRYSLGDAPVILWNVAENALVSAKP